MQLKAGYGVFALPPPEGVRVGQHYCAGCAAKNLAALGAVAFEDIRAELSHLKLDRAAQATALGWLSGYRHKTARGRDLTLQSLYLRLPLHSTSQKPCAFIIHLLRRQASHASRFGR